jgi:cell division transport system permease protein
MKIWLLQHLRALGATLGKLARTPFASLLNAAVIGVALALPAGLHVALGNLGSMAGRLLTSPQVSIFMSREADAESIARVRKALEQHTAVASFDFLPRDRALQELRASTAFPDVLDSLERNPLPDAFAVETKQKTARELESLQNQFLRLPSVQHVQIDSAWAQRLEAILGLGRVMVHLLGVLLGFGLVAVLFNTIRLQMLTQRDEIEVSSLFGATDAFIRRPFLYHGALIGVAGGLAAWAIVLIALHLLAPGIAALSVLYGGASHVRPPDGADGLTLIAFSASLGWLGAWLSVRRHLARTRPA